jgi:hypothetical protein
MKKSQTLKAMFEIETVFKLQSDSRALHFTLPQTETTTTSSTATVTSFQTIGFNKLPNDLRM